MKFTIPLPPKAQKRARSRAAMQDERAFSMTSRDKGILPQNYEIDKKAPPWNGNFYQFISLWEIMNSLKAYIHQIVKLLSVIESYEHKYASSKGVISNIDNERIERYLRKIKLHAKELGLNVLVNHIVEAQKVLRTDIADDLSVALQIVRKNMLIELKSVMFLHVDQKYIDYYNENELFTEQYFGPQVAINFPTAIRDIKEAGKCFALRRYTACVFHLMRITEIGLRILVWDRQIKFKKNSPIELKQFKELFEGLEKAEQDIHNYPKTMAREAQYEFYHGAMMQLRAFKNVYRDRTMHARVFYDEDEARRVFNQVSDFMKILATKISETKRTPLIWKKP